MIPSKPPPAPSQHKQQQEQPNNTQALTLKRCGAKKIEALRIVMNAVEGFGKTTFGSFAPNPAILMAEGESGYVTLRSANLVPDVDCIELTSWVDTLKCVDNLGGTYKTVVFDALAGFEKLCHKHVCNRDFSGDWGDKGFLSFHKGYHLAVNDWLTLLARLDKLRAQHGVNVVVLSHSAVKNFKNPQGPDFDRYVASCHDTTWSATSKWSDAVLFGNFMTVIDDQTKQQRASQRGKGIGGADRVIYTSRRDAWDAKNRLGMPEAIDLPNDPTQMWTTIWSAMTSRQNQGKE
jgi:hypothetical protein